MDAVGCVRYRACGLKVSDALGRQFRIDAIDTGLRAPPFCARLASGTFLFRLDVRRHGSRCRSLVELVCIDDNSSWSSFSFGLILLGKCRERIGPFVAERV